MARALIRRPGEFPESESADAMGQLTESRFAKPLERA